MTMPKQKPGKSKQDYETPDSLIQAIEKRFNEAFVWDLAATQANTKVVSFDYDDAYFGPDHPDKSQRDALKVDWCRTHVKGLLWLNPPFGNIDPWAEKCYEESIEGARIMFLTPASVGARWFQKHIFGKAHVMFLTPRLSFDSKAPFPKDCMLSYYHGGIAGTEVWDWKAFLGTKGSPLAASQTHREPKTASRQPKGHLNAP